MKTLVCSWLRTMDFMGKEESKRAIVCSPNLFDNEDLIIEILSRLPVKSLLRFIYVSKRWYNLIKSSYFISLHRNRLHRLNPNLFLAIWWNQWAKNYSWLLGGKEGDDDRRPLSSNIDLPNWLAYNKFIVGSSNGLVCLRSFDGSRIMVWNPSTGQRKYPPSHNTSLESPTFGFGFVKGSTTDYKVVRIGHPIQVFTRSENSWRDVKACIPSGYSFNNYPLGKSITTNGVMYWLGRKSRNQGEVFSFDLHDEVFHNISILPLESLYDLYELCSWKNSVALLAFHPTNMLDIWLLTKQSADDLSWTKHVSVEYPNDRLLFSEFWIFCNDQVMFTTEQRNWSTTNQRVVDQRYESKYLLCTYDPASKQQRKLFGLDNNLGCYQIVDYVESLTPV